MHGYDEAPVDPGKALDAMLRALGVAAEHISASTDERAGLYRSVLAGISEPVLVIADNASSEAQVRAAVVAHELELRRWFFWQWYWEDTLVDGLAREGRLRRVNGPVIVTADR